MQTSFFRKFMRKFFGFFSFFLITSFLTVSILFPVNVLSVDASAIPVTGTVSTATKDTGFQSDAPNAILMEATTGTILYEKDADKEKPPASVTKVMTLLLIFEALAKKQITLNDTVTVSEHAASIAHL